MRGKTLGANSEAVGEELERMWAAYRTVKAAGGPEWDQLVMLGAAGAVSSRQGGPAFGPTANQCKSTSAGSHDSLSTPNLARHLHSNSSSHGVVAGVVASLDLDKMLDSAVKSFDLEVKARKRIEEKRNIAITDWVVQHTTELVVAGSPILSDALVSCGAMARPCLAPSIQIEFVRVPVPLQKVLRKVLRDAPAAVTKKVEEVWDEMHHALNGDKLPKLNPKEFDTKLCVAARMCVCRRPFVDTSVPA